MKPFRLLDPILRLRAALVRRPGAPRGVLLVAAGGLGDTVLISLVLPRFMALARPGEPVTVLLRHDAAKMAFLFPPGVQVETVDFSRLRQPGYRARVAARLFAAHYRLAVSLDYLRHPDMDEALIAFARAPESAAMEARPSAKHGRRLAANRRLFTRLFDSGAELQDKVLRLCRFADFLAGTALPPPVVALPPGSLPPPAVLEAPTVVFQPFSAVKLKHSPPELWRAIIEILPAGWRVRIAGHPSDLERNPEFRPLLDLPGVDFEPAPFAQLVPILRAARLVVSVDTACMHLAAAVGAPTLCLASAAYVGEIVPYAAEIMPANLRVLHVPMPCQGCLGACRFPPERGMYPCVAKLDPRAVLAAVAAMVEAAP